MNISRGQTWYRSISLGKINNGKEKKMVSTITITSLEVKGKERIETVRTYHVDKPDNQYEVCVCVKGVGERNKEKNNVDNNTHKL